MKYGGIVMVGARPLRKKIKKIKESRTMKVLIGVVLFVVLSVSCVFSAHYYGNVTAYTITKANASATVQSSQTIRYLQKTGTSACQVYVSDANGTGYPIVAGTQYEANVPSNVSTLVFSCVSSAGNTIHVIK